MKQMFYSLLLHALALSMFISVQLNSKPQPLQTQLNETMLSAELAFSEPATHSSLSSRVGRLPAQVKKIVRSKKSASSNQTQNSILILIHQAIAAALTQLDFDREDHTQKIVELAFSIDKAGRIFDLRLAKSSGDLVWDNVVLTAAQDASPISALAPLLKSVGQYQIQIIRH